MNLIKTYIYCLDLRVSSHPNVVQSLPHAVSTTYAPPRGAKEVTRYIKRVWILVGQVEVESTNDVRFGLPHIPILLLSHIARHDDGLTEVNTMTKPKCVDFKICGDLTLSAGYLKGVLQIKAFIWLRVSATIRRFESQNLMFCQLN